MFPPVLKCGFHLLQAIDRMHTYDCACEYRQGVYRGGVRFGFVWFALLLAFVLCWVDRCLCSWVLLGLFCLLCVTQF